MEIIAVRVKLKKLQLNISFKLIPGIQVFVIYYFCFSFLFFQLPISFSIPHIFCNILFSIFCFNSKIYSPKVNSYRKIKIHNNSHHSSITYTQWFSIHHTISTFLFGFSIFSIFSIFSFLSHCSSHCCYSFWIDRY